MQGEKTYSPRNGFGVLISRTLAAGLYNNNLLHGRIIIKAALRRYGGYYA